MAMILQFSVFGLALWGISLVFWQTLAPALPRIIKIFEQARQESSRPLRPSLLAIPGAAGFAPASTKAHRYRQVHAAV